MSNARNLSKFKPSTSGQAQTAYIENGAITSDKIATDAVTADKIAANAVGSSEIAAGAVGSDELAASAVTQVKVGSGVSGTGPAFSAYQSVAQTLTSSTIAKIQFQTEEFDTANCFDNATNYRFTPNVAGYYQINGVLTVTTSTTGVLLTIYKNGSRFKDGLYATNTNNSSVNALVYLNGTTDYVELYGLFVTGQNTNADSRYTYFQGYMVRAA